MVTESLEVTEGMRTQVIFAREYLKDVQLGEKQVPWPSVLPCSLTQPPF